MKYGANEYPTKSVFVEELGVLVNRLLSRRHAEPPAYYRPREEQRSSLERIIGASPRTRTFLGAASPAVRPAEIRIRRGSTPKANSIEVRRMPMVPV
jgi:hypothetical protein